MTPTTMRVSTRYGSHLPALMAVMAHSDGPVLELGTGVFSTPYLHAACLQQGRQLWSCETDPKFYKFASAYDGGLHRVMLLDGWHAAPCERPWDVALVDHSPGSRRVYEIRRLADYARYIVVHDTNGRWEREYHYSTIWPLFRYRRTWDDEPSTTVVSNFVSLGDLW